MAKEKTALSKDEERIERMKRLCAKVNGGNFGGENHDAITFIGNNSYGIAERFTTGCKAIDYAFGGGVPCGKIIELFGGESAGKSTLVYHIISNFQKAYPDDDVALLDTEFCLAKGSLVYDAEKMTYFPIEDACGKEFTACSLVKGEMVRQRAKVSKSKTKEVFLVRTAGGREIRLTDNHRVLTKDGYKEVKDLVAGDIMYSPLKLPNAKKVFMSDKDIDLYRVLGFHIGDGTIDKAEIATVDNTVVSDLEKIAERNGDSVTFNGTIARFRRKSFNNYEVSKERLIEIFDNGGLIEEAALEFKCQPHTIVSRIREYGLDKKYNFKKIAAIARRHRDTDIPRVPTSIKNNGRPISFIHDFLSSFECFHHYSQDRRMPEGLNNYQLAQVLTGMYMSDGCVVDPEKQKRCSVTYSTTSRNLALDLQSSLQRLGIYSGISKYKKPREDGNGYYRTSYLVAVNGYENVSRFNECIHLFGYKGERVKKSLELVRPRKFGRSTKADKNGLIELQVLSVESDGISDTYDVSVLNNNDEEQNFLAEGLIVHNSFDTKYAEALGINCGLLLVSQPESGIQALNIAKALAEEEDSRVKLIVIDSIAALTTKSDDNGDIGEQTMAEQARMVSQAMRVLNAQCGKRGITLLVTNQVREAVGVMYGERTTTPAGKALKHYAHIRAKLTRMGQIKDKSGNTLGVESKLDCVKNKLAPPFRRANYSITYGIGIDSVLSMVELAIEHGVITKRGAWFSFGAEQIGQGQQATVDFLRTRKDLLDQIEAKLNEKLGSAIIGTSSLSKEETEAAKADNDEGKTDIEIM